MDFAQDSVQRRGEDGWADFREMDNEEMCTHAGARYEEKKCRPEVRGEETGCVK